MGQCHSLQMLAFGFDHLPFSLSFSFSRALAFLLSCSHSVACLLLACRLEHNTAGGLGGALYYDSCNKLDKSCMVQGVGPLSSSRAILLRDNSARAGGAIFVECKDMGSIEPFAHFETSAMESTGVNDGFEEAAHLALAREGQGGMLPETTSFLGADSESVRLGSSSGPRDAGSAGSCC